MKRRRREKLLVIIAILVGLLPLTWFIVEQEGGRPGFGKSVEKENVFDLNDRQPSLELLRPQQQQQHLEQQQQQQQHLEQQQQQQQQEQEEETLKVKRSGKGSYDDLHLLLERMEGNWHFWWIRKRIQLLWSEFEDSGIKLANGCRSIDPNKRVKVLILPGLLELTNFARPEVIHHGGPLGELVQWSDLIAGSHALCHEVLVRSQFSGTIAQLRADIGEADDAKPAESQADGCGGSLDFIYTDISGFKALPQDITTAYRNKFRIVDAFGTEAAYNDPEYALSHGIGNSRWAMLNLRLKQFYTLYPHSPDNSFLGFVISRSKLLVDTNKENYALIIGKEVSYLQGKLNLLGAINDYFPLRVTMSSQAMHLLPPGAEAIGIVDGQMYQELLRNAKVCVGLGDPVESPGVLEAIAQGCVFLNTRRKGTQTILTGKPTGRKVSSQVPYLEEYVGPPYVYTVDDDHMEELRRTLQTIRNNTNKPFLPHEFSVEGFVHRLRELTEHQNFCRETSSPTSIWPPMSAMHIEIAPPETSCTKACFNRGLVCEPTYFPIINTPEYFYNATKLSCGNTQVDAELYSPAIFTATKSCSFQKRDQLFSCAGGEADDVQRICPCRDFQPFQLAFCKQCANI